MLLDNNFASIVSAVLWGRNVYANITRFLQVGGGGWVGWLGDGWRGGYVWPGGGLLGHGARVCAPVWQSGLRGPTSGCASVVWACLHTPQAAERGMQLRVIGGERTRSPLAHAAPPG